VTPGLAGHARFLDEGARDHGWTSHADGGAFHLAMADALRIKVFAAPQGPVQCWRLFTGGFDEHSVYPRVYRPAVDAD
jgi:hypothetical protein